MPDYEIAVGITEDAGAAEHPEFDGTVGELAAIHEFTGRSWLRGWVDEREAFISETLRHHMRRGLQRDNMAGELEIAKDKLVQDLKQRILDKIQPPLAPATIARKGHDVPLIDTGTLFRTIAGFVDELL